MQQNDELTTVEKRELIDHINEMVRCNILNRDDRDDIFRICLAACGRGLAKLKKEE